jgi:hypothetical protein
MGESSEMKYTPINGRFALEQRQEPPAAQLLPVAYEKWEYRGQADFTGQTFWLYRGAGSEDTMRAYREAFRQWLQPFMLKDVAERDLSCHKIVGKSMFTFLYANFRLFHKVL